MVQNYCVRCALTLSLKSLLKFAYLDLPNKIRAIARNILSPPLSAGVRGKCVVATTTSSLALTLSHWLVALSLSTRHATRRSTPAALTFRDARCGSFVARTSTSRSSSSCPHTMPAGCALTRFQGAWGRASISGRDQRGPSVLNVTKTPDCLSSVPKHTTLGKRPKRVAPNCWMFR